MYQYQSKVITDFLSGLDLSHNSESEPNATVLFAMYVHSRDKEISTKHTYILTSN